MIQGANVEKMSLSRATDSVCHIVKTRKHHKILRPHHHIVVSLRLLSVETIVTHRLIIKHMTEEVFLQLLNPNATARCVRLSAAIAAVSLSLQAGDNKQYL